MYIRGRVSVYAWYTCNHAPCYMLIQSTQQRNTLYFTLKEPTTSQMLASASCFSSTFTTATWLLAEAKKSAV